MLRLSYPEFKDNLINNIRVVLSKGMLSQGKNVRHLEEMFSKYLGVRYAVAVSSGTAALHLALLSLGLKPLDEIIVPSFCFPAVANVVEICGAKAVFCDTDPLSFNMDSERLERKISRKTKAVIAVHLFGNPADMQNISNICRKRNIAIIEDAACALGASINGRKCGTIGKIGCFSFHPRKIITTAEGGMIVTNDKYIYKQAELLRNHGLDSDKNLYFPGFNYRMNEIEALMGIEQMSTLESKIKKRQFLANEYNLAFSNFKGIISVQKPLHSAEHVYQSFVVLLNSKISRDKLIAYLAGHSIESGFGTYAIHCLNYYAKKYKLSARDLPNSYLLSLQSISLPLHCKMKHGDIEKVVVKIKAFISRLRYKIKGGK